MMSDLIVLPGGNAVVFDAADRPLLSGWTWNEASTANRERGYALGVRRVNGRHIRVSMSRLLLGVHDDRVVDHINGDTLDNRRCNLRVCSRTENMRNRKRPKNNTSGFKGVTSKKTPGVFEVQIQVGRRVIRVGAFRSAIVAAVAYDQAAIQHHGEFARLNFSPDRDWILPIVPKGIGGKPPSVRDRT